MTTNAIEQSAKEMVVSKETLGGDAADAAKASEDQDHIQTRTRQDSSNANSTSQSLENSAVESPQVKAGDEGGAEPSQPAPQPAPPSTQDCVTCSQNRALLSAADRRGSALEVQLEYLQNGWRKERETVEWLVSDRKRVEKEIDERINAEIKRVQEVERLLEKEKERVKAMDQQIRQLCKDRDVLLDRHEENITQLREHWLGKVRAAEMKLNAGSLVALPKDVPFDAPILAHHALTNDIQNLAKILVKNHPLPLDRLKFPTGKILTSEKTLWVSAFLSQSLFLTDGPSDSLCALDDVLVSTFGVPKESPVVRAATEYSKSNWEKEDKVVRRILEQFDKGKNLVVDEGSAVWIVASRVISDMVGKGEPHKSLIRPIYKLAALALHAFFYRRLYMNGYHLLISEPGSSIVASRHDVKIEVGDGGDAPTKVEKSLVPGLINDEGRVAVKELIVGRIPASSSWAGYVGL